MTDPSRRRNDKERGLQGPQGGGLVGAIARGRAAKIQWIETGEVVSAEELGLAWGLTPQALGLAAQLGHVFVLIIEDHPYYPREFLQLDRADVQAVCEELRGFDPSEQFVFWKRNHGQIGGKTVAQALSCKQPGGTPASAVIALAKAYSAQMRADAKAQGR